MIGKTLATAGAVLVLGTVAIPRPAHAVFSVAAGNDVLAGAGALIMCGAYAYPAFEQKNWNPTEDGHDYQGLAGILGFLLLDAHGNPTPDLQMPTTEQARNLGITADELASLGQDLTRINAINESRTAEANIMLQEGATPAEVQKFATSTWKSDSAEFALPTVSAITKLMSKS